MIQIFLILIWIIVIGILTITSIIFLIITTVKRKNGKRYRAPLVLSIVFGVFALFIFNIDLTSAEATDRRDSIPAFESNFGFEPPQSVKEIKHKNFALYDTSVHWMSFSYDSIVFEQILIHDQPLLMASHNTTEHSDIISEFEEKNLNTPNWSKAPNSNTKVIYYKKDFLNHTFSEYYLWRSGNMVHLMVHYFD